MGTRLLVSILLTMVLVASPALPVRAQPAGPSAPTADQAQPLPAPPVPPQAPNIGPIPIFVPAFLITVIALYLSAGPFTAVAQNVVSPALRASSVTMLLFVAHVFGDSHSTFDVGFLADKLGGLQAALLITSPTLLVVAAIIAATGLRSVRPDMEAMEDEWAKRPAHPAGAAGQA